MSFDKIFILGAGGIGSVYGALLSEKNDVTLIGNEVHVAKIRADGLSIAGDIKRNFHPSVATEIESIREKSLVILTTKAYDSAQAIKGIEKLLRKDTIVLILQNGLGNEEIVKMIVSGRSMVLRGITKMAAEFFKPGRVRFWNGGTIIESSDQSHEIVSTFNASGLESTLSEHINLEVWTKLVINCVVNPLTAILHVRNCNIWEGTLETVKHSVVKECLDVAAAEGIALPRNMAETIDKEIVGYANFSSMYQDLAKGRQTEIDFLNGKIVELGKKHGTPTPVNETIVGLAKFLEGKHGISRVD